MKAFLIMTLLFSSVISADVVHIPFRENSTHSVHLSTNNLNRISVKGDFITHVICPVVACASVSTRAANGIGTDDSTRTLRVFSAVTVPFTFYIVTRQGRHISVNVTPYQHLGRRIIFVPLDASATEKAVEKNTPYTTLLIRVMKRMVQGQAPDGFSKTLIHGQPLAVDKGLRLVERVRYEGDRVEGRVYRLDNVSGHTVTLSPSAFYHHGVRAVALSLQQFSPHQSGWLYIVGDRYAAS